MSIRKAVARERGGYDGEVHARHELEQSRARSLTFDPFACDDQRRCRAIDLVDDLVEIAGYRRQAPKDRLKGRLATERLHVLREDEQRGTAPRGMDALER